MDRLTFTDKLLGDSDRLLACAVVGANLAIWLLIVPGNVLTAIS